MSQTETSASSLRRVDTSTADHGPAMSTSHVPPGRTWTITTRNGYLVRSYLPGWAEEDPSQAGIAPDGLRNALHDIIHRAPFDGQLVSLAQGGYGAGERTWVFSGNIECIPDAEDGKPPLPVANIHFFDDYWLTGLGPDEVAVFAAQLRAQADRLDGDVRPRLAAYRADWSAHYRRPTLEVRVERGSCV